MPRQSQRPVASNTKNTKHVKNTNDMKTKGNTNNENKPMTHKNYMVLLNLIEGIDKHIKTDHKKSMKLQNQEHHPPKHITHFSEAYTAMMLPRLKTIAKLIGGTTTIPSENPSEGKPKEVMSPQAEQFFSKATTLLNRPSLLHVQVNFRPNLIWMLTHYTTMHRCIKYLEKLKGKDIYATYVGQIDNMITDLQENEDDMKRKLNDIINNLPQDYTKDRDDQYNDVIYKYISVVRTSNTMVHNFYKELRAAKKASKGGGSGMENGGPPLEPVSQASKLDFKSIY